MEALLDEQTERFTKAIDSLEKLEEIRRQLPDSLQERLYLALGHRCAAIGDDARAMKSYGEAAKIALGRPSRIRRLPTSTRAEGTRRGRQGDSQEPGNG